MKWNKELVATLEFFVYHRNYIVIVGNNMVGKITPLQDDTFGSFGFGPPGYDDDIEDDCSLTDYEPDDFKVYERVNDWQRCCGKRIGD